MGYAHDDCRSHGWSWNEWNIGTGDPNKCKRTFPSPNPESLPDGQATLPLVEGSEVQSSEPTSGKSNRRRVVTREVTRLTLEYLAPQAREGSVGSTLESLNIVSKELKSVRSSP